MSMFGDAIVVVIFILLFVIFLGLCAFVNCMYQIQQTKKEKGHRIEQVNNNV